MKIGDERHIKESTTTRHQYVRKFKFSTVIMGSTETLYIVQYLTDTLFIRVNANFKKVILPSFLFHFISILRIIVVTAVTNYIFLSISGQFRVYHNLHAWPVAYFLI